MRLADFILSNREEILQEWETFARSTEQGEYMDVAALRDHAGVMLTAIAKDLRTPQDAGQQASKAIGAGVVLAGDTAAQRHGTDRADMGFTVGEMVAEFRALRASVLRLWAKAEGELHEDDIDDLTRFNEAIDQALAESVSRFTQAVDDAKEMFIAMLGHDLRTPLGAIKTSAQVVLNANVLNDPYRDLVDRIEQSANRTTNMVGDLLDFTRGRLGNGIPVLRREISLGDVIRDISDEIMVAHPGCRIAIDITGDASGEWDQQRIAQALGNLIGNAVQHGEKGTPVRVTVTGERKNVITVIHNRGEQIPRGDLNSIFNPMKSRDETRLNAASGPSGSLGLGLYIAERIVKAHCGTIDVTSTHEDGTAFTVCLPRR